MVCFPRVRSEAIGGTDASYRRLMEEQGARDVRPVHCRLADPRGVGSGAQGHLHGFAGLSGRLFPLALDFHTRPVHSTTSSDRTLDRSEHLLRNLGCYRDAKLHRISHTRVTFVVG